MSSLIAAVIALGVTMPARAESEPIHVQIALRTKKFNDVKKPEEVKRLVLNGVMETLKNSSHVKFFNWTDALPDPKNADTAARFEIEVRDSSLGNAVLQFRACRQRPPKNCELGTIPGAPLEPVYTSGAYVPPERPKDVAKAILKILQPNLASDTTAGTLHEAFLRLIKISTSITPAPKQRVAVQMSVTAVNPMPEWQLDVRFNESGKMALHDLERSDSSDEVHALINLFSYGKIHEYDPQKHAKVAEILKKVSSVSVMVKCFMKCPPPAGVSTRLNR